MQKYIFFISFFLFACTKNNSEKTTITQEKKVVSLSPETTSKLEGLITSYLSLKDALVKTDAKAAKTQAISLAEMTKDLLQEQSLTSQIAEIQTNASLLAGTEDVEKQRLAFSAISHATYDLAKMTGIKKGKLFKQFCPMAFHDKGDFWLSAEKQVMNPYFGNQMLHCGKVQEEL